VGPFTVITDLASARITFVVVKALTTETVIVAEPTEIALTTPLELTEATVMSLDI
jgi:hypothetical protein